MAYKCAACGRMFTSERAFNSHRQGEFTNEHPHYGRYCVDPAEIGLEKGSRGWREPMTEKDYDRLKKLREKNDD